MRSHSRQAKCNGSAPRREIDAEIDSETREDEGEAMYERYSDRGRKASEDQKWQAVRPVGDITDRRGRQEARRGGECEGTTRQTREVGREVLVGRRTAGSTGIRAACEVGQAERGKRTVERQDDDMRLVQYRRIQKGGEGAKDQGDTKASYRE